MDELGRHGCAGALHEEIAEFDRVRLVDSDGDFLDLLDRL